MNFNKLLFFVLSVFVFVQCYSDNEADSNGIRGFGNTTDSDGLVITGDQYGEIIENPFIDVSEQAVSTFSIDADGASYANVRRFIMQDELLPVDGAVRTEELINYFDLDYPYVNNSHPIDLNGEVSSCPWNSDNKLVRIGIQGKPIPEADLPASNFVFLIDVSGSMSSDDKLGILKEGFVEFVDELNENDRIAIVTYAGKAEVVLESTAGDQKSLIKSKINSLGSGGGTAGAQGIITAYEIAEDNFVTGGNNRIIVGTDGDFNIGPSSNDEIIELIEEKRESGVFLSVLGVGRGNLNDAGLEKLANNGNGTYEYIDNVEQLRKVFIHEFNKFYAIAKDVKVQVEFNDSNVKAYRLIGYENRLLNEEDFEDDTKDAGEIGSDQNITALYEIIPNANGGSLTTPTFDIDFRYKNPDEDNSIAIDLSIFDEGNSFAEASDYMKFTSSVAAFAMMLIDSEYKGSTTYDEILAWLTDVNLADPHNFKTEFKEIVQECKKF